VAVAILLLSWSTYFSELNLIAYDFTLRLAGPVAVKSPTVIVAIDEDSLGRVGSWPWSRDKLAHLIERVGEGKPRTIAVDVLLDDKTSLQADAALAASISKTKAIVLAAHINAAKDSERWLEPDSLFVQKHVRLGHVHTDPDFDGINRRILPLKATSSGGVVLAFAIQALQSAGLNFEADFERKVGSANVLRPEPVNIRFAGDNHSFPQISAWRVLEEMENLAQFENQIVLIGLTAQGLGDQWFTPFAETGQ
jgi:CHASE2 domain-containing sensor protein